MILGLEAHTAHISTSKSLELELLSIISGLPGAPQTGISTIVDNKGTIVSKIDKGEQGVLQGKIYSTNGGSYFLKYGFLIIPTLSLILSLLAFVLRFRK